jgi:tetratricopeptide (TPR) repeat protein
MNHFERAIALDPNFALAWIELSTAYRIGVAFTPDAPHDEWSMKATEALFRARELAPESHYILTIEAGNHAQAWGNWREAGRIFATMLASAPNAAREPGVSMMNGRILYLAGKPGAAVGALEHAKSLDPLSIEIALDLARAYASSGDLTAALSEGARAVALPGGSAYTSAVDLWTTLFTGDTARTDATLDALEAAGILSHSVRVGRLREDAAAARTEITRLAADPTAQASLLADLAMWASYYGDFDLALDLFRRPDFSGENAFMINYSVWSPLMQGVRRLPAFRELVRDHGLVAYWREYGWSDFCRPTAGDDFECE